MMKMWWSLPQSLRPGPFAAPSNSSEEVEILFLRAGPSFLIHAFHPASLPGHRHHLFICYTIGLVPFPPFLLPSWHQLYIKMSWIFSTWVSSRIYSNVCISWLCSFAFTLSLGLINLEIYCLLSTHIFELLLTGLFFKVSSLLRFVCFTN